MRSEEYTHERSHLFYYGESGSPIARSLLSHRIGYIVDISQEIDDLKREYEVVVLQNEILGEASIRIIEGIRHAYPDTRIMLAYRGTMSPLFPLMNTYKIEMIVDERCGETPLFPLLVQRVGHDEEAMALATIMGESASIESFDFRFYEDNNVLTSRLVALYTEEKISENVIVKARLILEELVNNALYHAFRKEGKAFKYETGKFKALREKDTVEVKFGYNERMCAVSVNDNAGMLKRGSVIDNLIVHDSKKGLYDRSGRGLYLSLMSSSGLCIDITEGVRTKITAFLDRKNLLYPRVLVIKQH